MKEKTRSGPRCGFCNGKIRDGETFRVVNFSDKGSDIRGPMPAHPECCSAVESRGYTVQDAPHRPEGS